jgi:CRISPR/Cas system endoribonuclease Cas6 (RAMP superfamily)
VRSVKNPATRARNVRYRVAASKGWTATFTIMWDKTVVAREEMKAAIRDAGMFVGIGDGRSIGFGRFVYDPDTDYLLTDV